MVSPATPAALAQLAENALSEWGIQGSHVELFTQRENTVYRVVTPGREVLALRVHRQGYHTLAELESEHAWTMALAEAGLAVPEAVPTSDGRAYAEIALPGSDETRQVGIVRWIDGIPLARHLDEHPGDDECARAFRGVGGIIADFHTATMAWQPPAGFTRHAWDADGFVGEAPFWGRFWEITAATPAQRERLSGIRDALRDQLGSLPKTGNAFGMIHADLHPDNVLVDGDALVVIDFDDAGFGWHAFDLAASLWDRLPALADRPQYEIAYDAITEGYASRRADHAHVVALVPTFLLMRTLMLLRWIEDRPEAGFDELLPALIPLAMSQAEALGI